MVIATDEQKPDLEQLQQDLQDIIQLTQSSILTKISETSAETEDASIEVSWPDRLSSIPRFPLNWKSKDVTPPNYYRMIWKSWKESSVKFLSDMNGEVWAITTP